MIINQKMSEERLAIPPYRGPKIAAGKKVNIPLKFIFRPNADKFIRVIDLVTTAKAIKSAVRVDLRSIFEYRFAEFDFLPDVGGSLQVFDEARLGVSFCSASD